jgi:hypothetical protein
MNQATAEAAHTLMGQLPMTSNSAQREPKMSMGTAEGGAAPHWTHNGSLSVMRMAAMLWPNSPWETRSMDAEQNRPRMPLTVSAHLRDLR